MTMRLDIVTNDAGELVRREHARELGAGVVVAIYRLAKLAMMHDLTNQAFMRQLEQTHQMISEYCLRSGANVNVLFALKAVFVAGQLLKGSRGTYDAAAELGDMFEKFGGSDLFIQRDITREELLALAEQISICHRTGAQFHSPTPKIRLRQVSDAARLRGIDLEDLSQDQRIVRAYASAVVIMRRFFEDLQGSKYILPRRIKRIAQSLVDLSDASASAFLGVTEVRNANFDEAGRAANTAIIAVSMARELTNDRTVLAQIAMAAMMHDVARPRAMALAAASGPAMPGMAGPSTLSEDQEDRLCSGAAAVLTALGRVNEPSMTRTVLTYETLWLRRKQWLGPVYWGSRAPTLHASIITVARRYNDLLTPEPGLPPPTPDYAVAVLASELSDPQDRSVLRMLVSALGLLPMGTIVQLQSGEVAEVVKGARGLGEKPVVRLLADAQNQPYAQQMDVDLAHDTRRQVLRVLSVDGWKKGLAERPQADFNEAYDPDAQKSAPPPPMPEPVRHQPPTPPPAPAMPPPGSPHISPLSPVISRDNHLPPPRSAHHYAAEDEHQPKHDSSSSFESAERNSSQSIPSMGSSPSAVAEAMGRMINDSLRPPAVAPKEGPERTVFQPGGPEELGGRAMPKAGAKDPTARGDLAATPLPHVLVYMLDHSLTGSVVFEGEGNGDTIYFVHGVPAKVRLSEPIALLGDVLVDAGALDKASIDQAADAAKRLGTLLGEYLVGHELVSREMLAWALESQLLQKIAHLANLAPEISYAYYRDEDLLPGWGAETAVTHPLNAILGSVRNWQDRARVRATLNRIGKHPLVIHPDADLATLAMMEEEQIVLDTIRAESLTLSQLFKRNIVDEEIVSSLIYTLAVTRQFAFKGQKKGPMAARASAWRNVNAGAAVSSGSIPAMGAPSVVPSAPSAPPAASGSRPAMPAPVTAAASAHQPIAMPPAPTPQSRAPQIRAQAPAGSPPVSSNRGGAAPSTQMRAAAAPSGSMPASKRSAEQPVSSQNPVVQAPPPPARGGGPLPRANAPQIRPIAGAPPVGKTKGTMVGLQPAAPPESRAPGSPGARPAQGIKAPAPPKSAPPGADDEDNAKTIAFMPGSSPLKDLLAKKKLPPNKITGEPTRIDPAVSKRVTVKQAEPAADVPIELDDGMADAEAALEAMQNFRMAEAALQRNDAAGAERLAQKAVDGDPGQADYMTLLAWVRALGGDPKAVEKAVGVMSKVLIEDPSNERALLYRARLLVRTNRLDAALNDFEELLATNPHHREAAAELKALKAKMG